MRTLLGAAPLSLLLMAHGAAAIILMLPAFFDVAAYQALLAHPQFWGGLALTLFTGVTSTVLALLLAVTIVMGARGNLRASAGAMLALPHLAFAIGLAFLLVPTGLIARLIAVPLGWDAPPQWVSVQDPHGLSLIAVLVLKETPFLVWAVTAVLQRDDMQVLLRGQMAVARSFGNSPRGVWYKVILPQVLPRIVWPLVAVLSYGMTVVDKALVMGPTQPPTLALVVWRDLNDAELLMNARGAAGVAVLALAVAGVLLVSVVLGQIMRRPYRFVLTLPPSGEGRAQHRIRALQRLWSVLLGLYVLVLLVLLLQSFSGLWPFPDLLPEAWSLRAWLLIVAEPWPALNTFLYGLATTVVALAAAVAWFETQPRSRDGWATFAAVTAFTLPALLIGLGQYRLFLALGQTGTWFAVFMAHVLPVMAYVFVMLIGPYRSFDPGFESVARGLGQSQLRFLLLVKWRLLKAPLFAAAAVGFAVSVAQFVPVQLAAAGRITTLATETVALSSGGNRGLLAASALLMMLLPLIAFIAAQRFGRSRWS